MSDELRKISPEELKVILEKHEEWLKSSDEAGERADLPGANLIGADLRGAYLPGANLNAETLSSISRTQAIRESFREAWAALRQSSSLKALGDILLAFRAKPLYGARVGVNGIWVEYTDTAALMPFTPPGDSMKGSNADAVVESLKQARRLHTFSLVLVTLGFVIGYAGADSVTIPFFSNLKVPSGKFALLAMLFSTGFLMLVKSFMDDALSGARYLQTRKDAQTVGSFPWALSRYTGRRWYNVILSYTIRVGLAFHPLAYLLLWDWEREAPWYAVVDWYYWVLLALVLIFSTWIFVISQQFQRPIVFDGPTERARKTDTERMAIAVEKLTERVDGLIERMEAQEVRTNGAARQKSTSGPSEETAADE